MNRHTYITVLIGTILTLLTFIPSKGEVYNVRIGQFEKLKINGDINVVYSNLADSTGWARYESGPGGDAIFNFIVKSDNSLKVEPADDKWGTDDLPVVYVYSNFLSSIDCYSNLNVEVKSLAPCPSFNVNQVGNGSIVVSDLKTNNVSAAISTGNGTIYLSGSCDTASFQMIGAGLISAGELKADNVKCRILGTGTIGCWPVYKLNVMGIGSTKIYYKGSPEIKKSGGGKLIELPD